MHGSAVNIDIDEVIKTEPIQPECSLTRLLWAFVFIGAITFTLGLFLAPAHLWTIFLVNIVFWMGLSMGGVMISVIVQIVRATWSAPIRRIAEANVAFLPYAYITLVVSWFGRSYLYPWARGPMPGREWWMQEGFAYSRILILVGFLIFLMCRYVSMSLRSDVGLVREKTKEPAKWSGFVYDWLTRGWEGSAVEVTKLQRKMSFNAPIVVFFYAVITSVFAFEMVMSMDTSWVSNMFGGFIFLGNIYIAWAMTTVLTVYFAAKSPAYRKTVSKDQLWDMGKLMFGFCMLWGYTMFSQYLPQWYGNLPEETQWLILRTKEMPWKPFSWLVFSMCFICPFILLVSEDIKKAPRALLVVCSVILVGVFLERYLVIAPQVFPHEIPFGFFDVAVTLGFLGAYFLSIFNFMSKYPYVPVSHPQSKGITTW